MLCCRKFVVSKVSPHLKFACALPAASTPQLLTVRQFVNFSTILKTTTKIQTTAGGPYGDELRPD